MPATVSPDFAGRSLLGVFAHPDDESLASGGLFALCADHGARVSLLCLTHGALDEEHASPDLGKTRAGELRAAGAVLGLADVILLDHEDGMLPWTDPRHLESDIRRTIDRLRPEVVVTFGRDGLYWHPDHIAVHERTTAVVAGMGQEAPSLYYVTMPAGQMRSLVDHLVATPAGPLQTISHDILGVEDVDAFGSVADPPTLVVETGDAARRKLAALKCHVTQVGDGVLAALAADEAQQFLGTEHYRRAEVGSQGNSFLEQLASAG